jgi:hypothetical protein
MGKRPDYTRIGFVWFGLVFVLAFVSFCQNGNHWACGSIEVADSECLEMTQ